MFSKVELIDHPGNRCVNGTVLDFCVCIQNDTRETLPQGCILLSASSDVQSDSPLLGSTVVLREGGTVDSSATLELDACRNDLGVFF